MAESECADYLAWAAAPQPLQSGECFHFWGDCCENGLSPHAGQECPWSGRPGNAAVVRGSWERY